MIAERNDPTHAGFTPPATGSVVLSFNEVESLCMKAAHGAGLGWGLAEEAGFAARWLFSRGLDGMGALLKHLDRLEEMSPLPVLREGVFSANGGGLLCPISIGAALTDFAALGNCSFRSETVHRPLLVLPFLHQIAFASGVPVDMAWQEGRVSVSAGGVISGDLKALAAMDEAEIAVAVSISDLTAADSMFGRAAKAETLFRLSEYAMLTTVPASAASRADAGSADGDND